MFLYVAVHLFYCCSVVFHDSNFFFLSILLLMDVGAESSLRISRKCWGKHRSKESLVSNYCISTEHTSRSGIAGPWVCVCPILMLNSFSNSCTHLYSCWQYVGIPVQIQEWAIFSILAVLAENNLILIMCFQAIVFCFDS